jgi:hypothetical protein
MASADGDVGSDSLDHDDLLQAVDRMEDLNANHTRATDAVPEIVGLLRPELDRDFAAAGRLFGV